MQIDWFTLIAQIINFLVLVWLLKHFLYSRIVEAMSAREAAIASRLNDATRQREEAEQETNLFRTKSQELENQRDELLTLARKEADVQRQQLMAAARLEAEQAQGQWFESLQREQREVLQELRERLGQQVFALARRALKELADADLERQMLKVFDERLQALDSVQRDAIVAAARESDREIEIRTAFPLLPEAKEGVSHALRRHLDDGLDVRFTTVPELICGIELRARSHRLVWNLDSYLEGLEDRVFGVLDERDGQHANSR